MLRFSRKSRLTSKQDFQFVFDKPFKTTQKSLLALYRRNAFSHARLGIIVGKHLVKHSVDRNLLRRIIRESFRHHQELIKGLDLIVILRSKWCPLNKKVLRDDVDHLWQVVRSAFKLA